MLSAHGRNVFFSMTKFIIAVIVEQEFHNFLLLTFQALLR